MTVITLYTAIISANYITLVFISVTYYTQIPCYIIILITNIFTNLLIIHKHLLKTTFYLQRLRNKVVPSLHLSLAVAVVNVGG